MSTPWTFKQRLAAYRAEGITKIVVMPGAETHNRDDETGKTFGPVHGVLIHHTAGVSKTMKDFVYRGTASLPGPLCHDFLAKDGTLYVVGHGRTNHAGTTTQAVKNAVIAEQTPGNQRSTGSETVDANDFLYGLEIENKGDGRDPYPAAQYDVAVRWAAAHCRFYGWGHNSVWGHKEITRRKVDPSFDMSAFRTKVAARLAVNPAPPKTTPVPAPRPAPVPASTTGASMDYTSLAYTGAGLALAPGQTREIYWNSEYNDDPADHGTGGKTILSGGEYTGSVYLHFADPLPEGVLFAPVQEWDDGVTVTGEPSAYLSAGQSRVAMPITGRCPEDRNLVVEITNNSAGNIMITWAGVRFLSQVI